MEVFHRIVVCLFCLRNYSIVKIMFACQFFLCGNTLKIRCIQCYEWHLSACLMVQTSISICLCSLYLFPYEYMRCSYGWTRHSQMWEHDKMILNDHNYVGRRHSKTTRWSMYTFMQTSCAIGKCDDPIWEHDALNMGTSVIMWECYF
jgi:hypothetical protein